MTTTTTLAERMLDVGTIYHEANIERFARGAAVLAHFPDAERIIVPSHWNIPGLHGNAGLVRDWVRIKRNVLVLGVKKGMQITPNERSADFIAPSHASGCAMACAYCYVPRRKGFANPITTFVNIEQITSAISRHAAKQGWKLTPTQADERLWVYEIGTNNDCAVDALISDNVRDLVHLFRDTPNAKATFATKFVNPALLEYDPQRKTRIRFSLMPPDISRIVDVRTSPIGERIAAMNAFHSAGYEVNISLGPVIITDDWLARYDELLGEVDAAINAAVKAQMSAEIIFLTHDAALHDVNLGWHPKAEDLLWRPEIQEYKTAQISGSQVLRYQLAHKRVAVRDLLVLLKRRMPYCQVRYAF